MASANYYHDIYTGEGDDLVKILATGFLSSRIYLEAGSNTVYAGENNTSSFRLFSAALQLPQTYDTSQANVAAWGLRSLTDGEVFDLRLLSPGTALPTGLPIGTGSNNEIYYLWDYDTRWNDGYGDDQVWFNVPDTAAYTILYDAGGWVVHATGFTDSLGNNRLEDIETLVFFDWETPADRLTGTIGTNGYGEAWTLRNEDDVRVARISGDSDDRFEWSTFSEGYDPVTGQRIQLDTVFDDGRIQHVTLDGETQDFTFMSVIDAGDAYVWQEYYDQYWEGNLSLRNMTMDNLDIVRSYYTADGVRSSIEFLDYSDTRAYYEIFDQFDTDSGHRTHRLQVMDDGDQIALWWNAAGVRTEIRIWDNNDDSPWNTYLEEYYDTGVLAQRSIYEDTGTQQVQLFDEAGILRSIELTDIAAGHAWFTQTLIYNDARVVVEKELVQDNADIWTWNYSATGVLETFELQDISDAHAWDTRVDVYEADGVTLDYREFHYDDGSTTVIDF